MAHLLADMTTALPPYSRPGQACNTDVCPLWVPAYPVPRVGSRVYVQVWRESLEDLGIPGTVLGYQACHGCLMVWVKPDRRPKWHLEQNPERWAGLFAGRELRPMD